MKQLEVAERMCQIIANDIAVRAIFLKGSLARDDGDEFSDIDFYCLVKENERDEFLKRRLDYLRQYRPIIYWSEANFVGPQIVAVFDNGLHFDLYTVTLDSLPKSDQIKVLYDPEKLLINYVGEPLKLTENEVCMIFNGFVFSLLEFETAYFRNDLLWASRLASHLSGDLAIILRHLYDTNNSKLGFKRLYRIIGEELHQKLIEAMNQSGPSYLPTGVILLAEILNEIVEKLPDEILCKINLDFFYFMLSKIRKLQ